MRSMYLPMMQIRNKSIVLFDQYNGPTSRLTRIKRQQNMANVRGQRYSGRMTIGARKRMTKAITLLSQMINPTWIYNNVSGKMHLHRLTFITLTIAENDRNLTAREAYDTLLVHFLQWLRRTKGVTTYVWKAELQARGQIHYHLTTPSFIDCSEIRAKWNTLQRNAGLVDSFKLKYGHDNPPSTETKEVRSVNDFAAYMIKELTKGIQNSDPINGKVWDCSDNLKINKYFTLEREAWHDEFLHLAVQNDLAVEYSTERFSIVHFVDPPEEHLLTEAEFSKFRAYLNCVKSGVSYTGNLNPIP